jgi:3-hydroxyisobutyrate dehydrogenase
MGLGMARNLARAGIDVRAWNRTRRKAEPLSADGAAVLDTPGEAAAGAGVILTMLADADAVLAAMDGEDGALARAADTAVWLQMSTIGEAATERCAELAGRRGLAFVDAPVLGTKEPAQEGKLTVMASGPEALAGRLAPIFDAVGQRTMWVGPAGQGTRLKLVTNSWILAVVEGAAETIALAEGLGVDPALFLEAVGGGPLDLPYLQRKGRAILERDFAPSFSLRLATKDARLVEDAAAAHELDLPLARVIHARLAQGVVEHGDDDLCATYLTSAPGSAIRPG